MNIKKDIHYYLYKDEELIKSIYSQLVSDMPDVGIVEYFGGDTQNYTRDYKIEAFENDREKEKCDKALKTEVKLCKANATAIIRESANIQEIKAIKRNTFYNDIIKEIECFCKTESYGRLVYLKGQIYMYRGYNDKNPEMFFEVRGKCIWLKKDLIKTDVVAVSNFTGDLNIIGYVFKKADKKMPEIIRAIAIYI